MDIDNADLLRLNETIDGFPSFQEFCKDPDKYRSSVKSLLDTFDNGSQVIRTFIRKHLYFFEGYEMDSLEQLERVIKDEGLDWRSLDFKPEIVNMENGKCDIKIDICRKGFDAEKAESKIQLFT